VRLVWGYFRDSIITGFLSIGAIWFLIDATLFWKNRAYTPKQMRLFLWGWNAAALMGMFWNWGARYAYSRQLRSRISPVSRKCLLEISVETLEGALAAERGGADRIELCGDLSAGGITPNSELMRAARARVRIPIFAMIRPRAGDFVYSGAEFSEMQRSIADAKELEWMAPYWAS